MMTGYMSPSKAATNMAMDAARKEEEAAAAASRQAELDAEYRRLNQRGRQAAIVQPTDASGSRSLLGA